MLKGMNTEVYGEGHPFGDPSWYQAYNTPYYNDTHKQFRKLMREYVDEHIMGNVHDWDEKGTIPKEMYLEAGKQGTLALCIGRPWPEKYFGPSPWGFEPDYFHELIMYDEMSRTGSVGFQWGIAGGTTIGLPPVYHHGSEELKQRVMPPCVKGEKVCCLAITEPTAGSDVANLKCTAKLEGDFYILNGEKKWILSCDQLFLLLPHPHGSLHAFKLDGWTSRLKLCREVSLPCSPSKDHKWYLRRLLHRCMPHWQARCGWHQLAPGGEGHAGSGVQKDEVLWRMVIRHNLHHVR